MTTQDAPDWQTVVLPIVVVSTAPSSVVIAPNRLTTVQRTYLANSTGTVDLVAAPQPAVISVVQYAIALSADKRTVAFTLLQTPQVGNLLALSVASSNAGAAMPAISGWAQAASSNTTNSLFTRSVTSTDTTSFDITVFTPNVASAFAAVLYEISGVNLTTPVTDTKRASTAQSTPSVTGSISATTNPNEFALSSAWFLYDAGGGAAFPTGWSTDVAGGIITSQGVVEQSGIYSYPTYLTFAAGPLVSGAGDSISVTAQQTATGASMNSASIYLGMLNPASSPVSQEQIRVWALDILGSSTDQPYIERNDTLATLLSTTGPISRWVSFEPGGLLLPAGTGLTATAVDSADFGAVWQLA